MKKYGFALVVAAIIIAIVVFPSDKKRIRKAIRTCEQAVVNENSEALMSLISFNYSDDYGGSYLTLKKRSERLFKTYDDFDFIVDIVGITVNEGDAVADLKLSLIASEGNERGYLFGDAGSHQEIKVYFEKEKFGWTIIRLDKEKHL
jgi:hypothetical protein